MTADPTLPTCAVHRDRETRLRCSRCGRAVCDVCLQQEPGWRVCPQCHQELAEDGGTDRGQTHRLQASAPLTFGLLLAYGVVYLVGELTGGTPSLVIIEGAQINDAVMAGQWWRVLTATMLHAGITHLLFNGYALYVLGPQLERSVGSAAFAALYAAAGLAGGVAFLFTAPGEVAVGASGAIFGLFGAWFGASWARRDTPQGRAGLSQFGLLLLINLALPLFIPGIAWQAHLGGLLVGLVSGLWWAHLRGTSSSPGARVLVPALIGLALLVVLLWYT
ncbi:MAG: rhomboid family intramembrane serine protease [Actinobacteria bacterium]|nr:rhomboid family intramembrane serine protease [Actinomycetota bacterium]